MLKNPYESYKKQSVMTMTPGDMLNTLYSEILKECTAAKIALGKKDYSEVNRALQKVQRILSHLKATLDFKYEVSKNLDTLYDYFKVQTIEANMKKDASKLDEIMPMIADLRDTYAEADRLSRTPHQKQG